MSRSGSDNLAPHVLVIVAAVFVASGAALGDVPVSVDKGTFSQTFETLPPERQPHPPAREITHQANIDWSSRRGVEFTDILSITDLSRPAYSHYYEHQSIGTQARRAKAVCELRPGPGGATLFLMGVACIGAVKLGKSARSLHLQSLPDWYHSGGPIQVGHVSVLDLDVQILSFGQYDQSSSEGSASFSHPPQPLLPIEARCFLTVVDVRGPPLLHL